MSRGADPRKVRVRALAKINLELRVLGKRPDGYHELRTVFQTISVADTIDISYSRARETSIVLEDPLGIPDNLITRAARLVMDAMRATGRVEMRLRKRIPMGAGLGGGSSDAAAVLLALPTLCGKRIDPGQLHELARQLGSDVPFFLLGGTAVGIGRGTELFPLPDLRPQPGLLVTPGIHVSTAEAYRRLSEQLVMESAEASAEAKVSSFQARVLDLEGSAATNDFEAVVFAQHPQLGELRKKLRKGQASTAMMTGSGSALFGLFASREQARRAAASLDPFPTLPFSFVTRARYGAMWRKSLAGVESTYRGGPSSSLRSGPGSRYHSSKKSHPSSVGRAADS